MQTKSKVEQLIWIPCEIPPVEAGSYLVNTAHGKIRIDRYDGHYWGLCKPRAEISVMDKGRYKPHRAWAIMPKGIEK